MTSKAADMVALQAALKFGPRPTAFERPSGSASLSFVGSSGIGYDPAMGRTLVRDMRTRGFDWETIAAWCMVPLNGRNRRNGVATVQRYHSGTLAMPEERYEALCEAYHGG